MLLLGSRLIAMALLSGLLGSPSLITLALLLWLLCTLLLLIRAVVVYLLLRFLGVTGNTCSEKYQQFGCCDKSFNSCHGSYLVAT